MWNSLLDQVKVGEARKSTEIEVAPKPSFCVKTKEKEGGKVFLNICTVDSIPEPKKKTVEDLVKMLDSEDEMIAADYRIPMSIGEAPHAEVDKKGVGCSVHDIAINPNYVKILKSEPAFMNFFLQVVFEGLTAKFSIELEWDWVILKNRTHVGRVKPHMIRTYKKPVIQELEKTESNKRSAKKSSKPTQPAPKPDYIVLQEPIEGTPNYLIIEVWLPGIESSSKLTLDVGEDRLTLHAHPAKYFLDIELPYDVVPLESGAQYDTEAQLLTVALMTTCAVDLPGKPDRVLSLDREKFLQALRDNDK
ncbi:hypothetical protein ACHWQZ_G003040 [Mnemiopsis leidyi]